MYMCTGGGTHVCVCMCVMVHVCVCVCVYTCGRVIPVSLVTKMSLHVSQVSAKCLCQCHFPRTLPVFY